MCLLLQLVYALLDVEPRPLYTLGKHSSYWAMSPALQFSMVVFCLFDWLIFVVVVGFFCQDGSSIPQELFYSSLSFEHMRGKRHGGQTWARVCGLIYVVERSVPAGPLPMCAASFSCSYIATQSFSIIYFIESGLSWNVTKTEISSFNILQSLICFGKV